MAQAADFVRMCLAQRGDRYVYGAEARLDDPDLDIDESCVMVLRGCGPKGYPGMPEAANTPLPAKLLAAGVRDMIRICDGRMSGTAYGTVVLHVAPESAAGGPLSLVRDGDMISLAGGSTWTSQPRSCSGVNRPSRRRPPTARH